ncbi:MFS transporter [Luteitalea sp. TBR-22]|uniref:MFS transporter n=1 Tax=Luteitalea sp. TBR-22 TaxID=2802971 RepID=UPI001AFAD3B4|nr:MFS transporter [Luteitalea sp. TBR-22]BCS33705.1 MFS transporter [Luteitalea sp. TBR-22]
MNRNLLAIAGACFIGFSGFTLVMPFLPIYFGQLGMRDPGDIALWSGLSLGVTPGMTALLAPLWGRVADRYGNKFLVLRSLACFVITMVLFGLVTRPWHVFGLRVLQGFFAGYGALAVAMAAQAAPRERMATAIGTVQTAQRLGPAVGPIFGGVLAVAIGIRASFFVSSLFYLAAFVLVWRWFDEGGAPRQPRRADAVNGLRFASGASLQQFVLLMGVILALQLVDKSFGPILPLYLQQLGVSAERVAPVAGLLFSGVACAGAVGNMATQRLLHRYAPRPVLRYTAIVAAVGLLPFVFGAPVWLLMVSTLVFGLAIGVAMTASFTAAGHVIPEESRSTGFGLLTSASLVGLSLSPVLSGVLARTSIRSVFTAGVITLGVLAATVSYVLRDRVEGATWPSVEET